MAFKNMKYRNFPGGPVVKNPPSNAGDTGSIPGGGTKIPHAAGQLSPCVTTTELTCLNERAHLPPTTEPTHARAHVPWSLRTTTRERKTCTPQVGRSLRTTTKSPRCNERSHMPQWRPSVPQLRPDAAKKNERKNLSHSKLAVSSEFFGVKTSSLIGGLSRDNEDDH